VLPDILSVKEAFNSEMVSNLEQNLHFALLIHTNVCLYNVPVVCFGGMYCHSDDMVLRLPDSVYPNIQKG